MGASYQQASSINSQIQQSYDKSTDGNDDLKGKEEFWNETREQIKPNNNNSSPASKSKVKMPNFPDFNTIGNWMMGGGYTQAVQAYSAFHKYLTEFTKQFQNIHSQTPNLGENSILRDYPNERFALDCITEMFFNFSNIEWKKYQKSIDEITQRANDFREIYNKKNEQYSKELVSCLEGCSDDYCIKECNRKYCLNECPNANELNDKLDKAYNDYRTAFNGLVSKQIKLLDDLYAFANP